MATAAELLAHTNDAIDAILTGAQAYTERGRSAERAKLADLVKMRRELLIESTASSQMATLGQFSGAK